MKMFDQIRGRCAHLGKSTIIGTEFHSSMLIHVRIGGILVMPSVDHGGNFQDGRHRMLIVCLYLGFLGQRIYITKVLLNTFKQRQYKISKIAAKTVAAAMMTAKIYVF